MVELFLVILIYYMENVGVTNYLSTAQGKSSLLLLLLFFASYIQVLVHWFLPFKT